MTVAHRNGIDVGGAWETSDGGTTPEWDVVVTPLSRSESVASGDGNPLDGDEETD